MGHRRAVSAGGAALAAGIAAGGLAAPPRGPAREGIWTSAAELREIPAEGPAWDRLKSAADRPLERPQVSGLDDHADVRAMAMALVHARTSDPAYRDRVIQSCMDAVGTEQGGTCLALGRNLIGYVIAADLVGLPAAQDEIFRAWLKRSLEEDLAGRTLRSTHEKRPNNWGTHAGASRAAAARYLGDGGELERVAVVFRGWLGDRGAYAGFRYGELWWQADPAAPVGINPAGATRTAGGAPVSIDGVLPDDQRRAGPFRWPPPRENYVYEALQGALAQAVILHRAGYDDVWEWEDQALRRAFRWLHDEARFPAEGDDAWQPHVINHYYGADFPAPVPAGAGKNVGWTDWSLPKRPSS